ncbi:MAG: polysaccharide biosynthesis/export family protein [Methylococcaceae bacterium]
MHRLVKLNWILMLLALFFSIRLSIAADVIGPDDVLRISVYGYEDLKTETRVAGDGRITFPLIGEIQAAGKSSIELEEAIAIRLIEGGFIHNAQVSVAVSERVSQHVSVLGYVNNPGRYALDSDSSVIDLIAMAGGVNDAGDSKILVTRSLNGNFAKYEFNLADFADKPETVLALKMQKGDVVFVPKAPVFYIYGEVQRPGGYRLETDLNIAKALSIGGGLTPRGSENGLQIKRKNEQGNLEEIDVGLATTVLKDDVIYVKERWF